MTHLSVPTAGGVESWTGLQVATNLVRLTVDQSINGRLPIAGLNALRFLDVWRLNDLSESTPLPNLEELHCSLCEIADLSPLRGLPKLKVLRSVGLPNPDADLAPLAALKELTSLGLSPAHASLDFTPLAGLGNLVDLSLEYGIGWLDTEGALLRRLVDLTTLAGLANLRRLYLGSGKPLLSLEPVGSLISLQSLTLWRSNIDDLAPLSPLINLEILDLSSNRVVDLEPLRDMVELRHLSLDRNQIEDLSPLSRMAKLQQLDVSVN